MWYKNECLKVCPRRVLQGHNSNICFVSPILSPALPSSLHSDGCPGETEITGALWLYAHLSAQFFTPKDPQIKPAQSATRTVMVSVGVFLQGSPSHSMKSQEFTNPPLPQNCSCHRVFFSRQSSSRKNAKTRTKCLSSLMDSILNNKPVKETGRSLEGWTPCW